MYEDGLSLVGYMYILNILKATEVETRLSAKTAFLAFLTKKQKILSTKVHIVCPLPDLYLPDHCAFWTSNVLHNHHHEKVLHDTGICGHIRALPPVPAVDGSVSGVFGSCIGRLLQQPRGSGTEQGK